MQSIHFQSFLNSFRAAASFISTLPIAYPVHLSSTDQRRSIYYYPLVGLLLGFLVWIFSSVLIAWFPNTVGLTVILSLTFWVALTGALHLDGLADCADAWMGGLGDREKTLRILKDPNAGAIAVVVLVLVIGIKAVALFLIYSHGQSLLVLVPLMIARVSPIWLYSTTPYVRQGGIGEMLKSDKDDREFKIAAYTASFAIAVILLGWLSFVVIAVALVVFAVVRHFSIKRLRGFTGDVAGALIELIELTICITLAFFYSN